MVKRVYGTVDNTQITFTYNESSGRWEAIAPDNLEGTYQVALYAEDEAGNVTYITTALCTIDTSQMCITVDTAECSIDVMTASCSLSVVRCDICGRW